MIDLTRRALVAVLLSAALLAGPSRADVKLVTVEPPDKQIWAGEKASFIVKLRGKGSFVGASAFSIPQIPRSVILKLGNPVVSSEEIDGDSWFVQTHEFAVFSQVDGRVEVPSFEVRFSVRDGFTGPARDHSEQVPAFAIRVRRPPGSDPDLFLVTTDSIAVDEQWEPSPKEVQPGAVFRRSITQRADQVSGMALAPAPTTAPQGVRVHVQAPEISDATERGDFTGNRTDRLTYVFEQPGTYALPAIKYVWWNPRREEYGSKLLPAVTFQVAAVPENASDLPTPVARVRAWWLLIAGLGAVGVLYRQRRRIARVGNALWQRIDPPDRRIARTLLRACRQNDAVAAQHAWSQWRAARPSSETIPAELTVAANDLQRLRYGPKGGGPWDGRPLAIAFSKSRAAGHWRPPLRSALPPLNPTGA